MAKNDNKLDQFYTKPEEAQRLYDLIFKHYKENDFDMFIEPSCGKNSFGCLFPKRKELLLDIDPPEDMFKHKDKKYKQKFIKIDFLSFGAVLDILSLSSDRKVISIGNPPFGKSCSLAIKFFNICAKFSDVICFIIPRTFKRISVQNQLNMNFHLIHSEDLPYSNNECIFEPVMNAKCCFQIWEKRDEQRQKIILPKQHTDWEFLGLGDPGEYPFPSNKDTSLEEWKSFDKKRLLKGQPTVPKQASFAMKAYGSNCGEIVTKDLHELRPKSWHWIKCDDPEWLIGRFGELDYSISDDTVRQNSIGRAELVKLYTDHFNNMEEE